MRTLIQSAQSLLTDLACTVVVLLEYSSTTVTHSLPQLSIPSPPADLCRNGTGRLTKINTQSIISSISVYAHWHFLHVAMSLYDIANICHNLLHWRAFKYLLHNPSLTNGSTQTEEWYRSSYFIAEELEGTDKNKQYLLCLIIILLQVTC